MINSTTDMRRLINTVNRINSVSVNEARSNSELNTKIPAVKIIQDYVDKYGPNGVFVHFNNIEKVGINLNSQNTFGPTGIYAMPIGIAVAYGLHQSKLYNPKYLNILLPAYTNLLDLSKVDISTMQSLLAKALAFHKKKVKDKAIFYTNYTIPNSVQECWVEIIDLLSNYARRKGKNVNHILNIFFRKHGIDAIYDNSRIINDNPNQILFLSSKAFKVIKTIQLRF